MATSCELILSHPVKWPVPCRIRMPVVSLLLMPVVSLLLGARSSGGHPIHGFMLQKEAIIDEYQWGWIGLCPL